MTERDFIAWLLSDFVSLRENDRTRWLIVDASLLGVTDEHVAMLISFGIPIEDYR